MTITNNNFTDLNISEDRSTILGMSFLEILKDYKLPVHFYYEPAIRRNIRAFKEVFGNLYPKGSVRYAAKANTHGLIMDIIKKEEVGADVASYNETRCALESGVPPEKLDLNGNCKSRKSLEEAMKAGILIVADSIEDFEDISETAREINLKPNMLMRISGYNLGKVTASNIFTAGTWTKFGTPLKEIPGFIKSLHNYPHINFLGFHTHIGSQVAEVEPYLAVLGKMVEMGHLLNAEGIPCKVINIGGGFPVNYVDETSWKQTLEKVKEGYKASLQGDDSKIHIWDNSPGGFERDNNGAVNFSEWAGEKLYSPYPKEKMLEAVLKGNITVNGSTMNSVEALKQLGEPELIIEPGRSIVEDAGVTIARVGFVRKVAGSHNIVTLEMGVMSLCDSLLEPSLRRCEILNDYGNKDSEPFETFVGGNLCFSGDMIFKIKVPLQRKPKKGDIVMIYDTGAYSSTFMASNANSFPRPERVMIYKNGGALNIRFRESYHNVLTSEMPF